MKRSVKSTPGTSLRRSDRTYRRWSVDQKRKIVAETYLAGQSVSMVARRHDVNANQVFRWRRQFEAAECKAIAPVGFVPVDVVDGQAEPSPMVTHPASGMMTIVLCDGISVRVDRDVDDRALRRVLKVIVGMT